MIVVLDASAAIEVVLQRDFASQIAEVILKADWVIAPNLYISEVANVFWKYQKLAHHPYEECEKNIDQAIALPDEFITEIDLYREAFNVACMLSHPVYDMMYLVLARRHSAILLTKDKKLSAAAKKSGLRVL